MYCFFKVAGAVRDPEQVGLELASLSDAKIEAARFVAELMRDRPEAVWQDEDLRVEVSDETGLLLFTIIVLGIDAPSVPVFDWG